MGIVVLFVGSWGLEILDISSRKSLVRNFDFYRALC